MKKELTHPRYTVAFSLAALLLYLPANVFPILRLNLYGATSENTVWQGCVRFYEEGDYFIASLVFLASIVIPRLKIVGLLCLSLSVRLRWARWKTARVRLYLVVDSVIPFIQGEHPTIGVFRLFGYQVWLGWPMFAALIFSSALPPFFLGRMMFRPAKVMQQDHQFLEVVFGLRNVMDQLESAAASPP